MALEDIVTVSITSATVTPTRPGFGTSMVLANKVPATFTNRVRSYSSTSEMVTAGFLTTDPAYLAVTKIFSQNPRPAAAKVGRRATKTVQSLQLTVTSAVQNEIYSGKIAGVAFTYTVLAAATTTTVATALELLIEAIAGVDSTSSVAVITFGPTGATPGVLIDVSELSSNFTFKDVSTNAGVAADLEACNTEDPDWFGLVLDSQSEVELNAAAAWIETKPKIMSGNSSDSDIWDSVSTTDIASDFKAAAYANSGVLYSGKQLLSYSGAAWQGNRFVAAPGSDTWAYKTLRGVTVDVLTSGQRSAILAKNANVYTAVAGVNVTEFGTVGSGEYFDVRRGIYWLQSEIRIRVFAALANAAKIPYTDKGVDTIVAIVMGCLADGIRAGLLANDPYPIVTAPKVADVDPVTRGTRRLPDVKFTANLAGAIHTVSIEGTVSV